ncbi:DUF6318 family protein [Pseudarthrobacter sp. J75]|uniref:DUF6318 family protein n=1 Tax=unclassified Pseudarthrobacter TaxID=2647000 RepID=UPI002E7FFCE6|nr:MULTISPECIES: DUF6318 family protein [unclassified Pseudarthrobacter]MEE2524563.1 DUF6318 family protein [Pseudarthrobacter sp. J47]MEE2527608.1 DUF6318 family protein [Pseudarthrobacter sp. J75]
MKTFPGTSLASIWSVVAVCVLLTGCQVAGERATGTDRSPAATSISPTSTTTPEYKPADASGKAQNVPAPVKPRLADENSKDGLEAFTKYWFETLNYANETGKTPANVAISNRDTCKLCVRLMDVADRAWADGKWVSGGQIRIASVEGHFDPSRATQEVTLRIIQQESRIHMPDGSLYQEDSPAQNNGVQAVVTFGADGWKMDDLGLIL